MCRGETAIPVSMSFGVASVADPGISTPESLLREADSKLYCHKKARKTGEFDLKALG